MSGLETSVVERKNGKELRTSVAKDRHRGTAQEGVITATYSMENCSSAAERHA